mmetsp:Transcript_50524/g.113544  ORF Transcript_50524/g.113544 Transcript_50524/m.113544 type:complete len:96 (+) Transcript_50524:362-649(+)
MQLATQLTAAVKTAFEAGGNLPPAKVAGKAAAKESECCGKKEVTGECCGAQAKVKEVAGSCCAKQGTSLSTPQLVLVGLAVAIASVSAFYSARKP